MARTAATDDLPPAHSHRQRVDLGSGVRLVHLLPRNTDQRDVVRLDAGRRCGHRYGSPVVCLRTEDRLVQQPVLLDTDLDHAYRIRGVCSGTLSRHPLDRAGSANPEWAVADGGAKCRLRVCWLSCLLHYPSISELRTDAR